MHIYVWRYVLIIRFQDIDDLLKRFKHLIIKRLSLVLSLYITHDLDEFVVIISGEFTRQTLVCGLDEVLQLIQTDL